MFESFISFYIASDCRRVTNLILTLSSEYLGEDAYNPQELAIERWRPILGVEAIILSVISMLCDPNIESPANLDAAKLWRDDLPSFKKMCRQCVRKSQEDA